MADFSDITVDSKRSKSGSTSNAVTGTVLRVTIFAEDWNNPGETLTLECGSFEVCGMKLEGPPSTASIEGVSVSLSAPVRREKHTRGWEDTTLRDIASDVATRGELELVFELDDDPSLDRVDQRQESDLAFLNRLAKDHGASVKVFGGKLVVFSEQQYESKPATITFKRGDNRLLSYSFTQDSSDVAAKAEATYKDPKSGKWVKEVFDPPNAPAVGRDLIVNARPYNMSGDKYRNLSAKKAVYPGGGPSN